MKKASFIIGLIGGILGIVSCGILLFTAFNMKVTESDGPKVLMFSAIGLLLSILALVGACLDKKILAGIFILVGAIANIPCVFYSIPADSPMTFIMCIVTAILLLISGIMKLCIKE